jgi:transposase
MSESEWQVLRPLLPVPGWLQGQGGRPEGYCHRVMLDAVRYVVDNGVKWVNLPTDFPPFRRVHAFARRWQATGLLGELHDRLRDRVRVKEGRSAKPARAARCSARVALRGTNRWEALARVRGMKVSPEEAGQRRTRPVNGVCRSAGVVRRRTRCAVR